MNSFSELLTEEFPQKTVSVVSLVDDATYLVAVAPGLLGFGTTHDLQVANLSDDAVRLMNWHHRQTRIVEEGVQIISGFWWQVGLTIFSVVVPLLVVFVNYRFGIDYCHQCAVVYNSVTMSRTLKQSFEAFLSACNRFYVYFCWRINLPPSNIWWLSFLITDFHLGQSTIMSIWTRIVVCFSDYPLNFVHVPTLVLGVSIMPLFEEALKFYTDGFAGPILFFIEVVGKIPAYASGNFSGYLFLAWFPLHLFSHLLPFKYAVLYHVFYNIVAFYVHRDMFLLGSTVDSILKMIEEEQNPDDYDGDDDFEVEDFDDRFDFESPDDQLLREEQERIEEQERVRIFNKYRFTSDFRQAAAVVASVDEGSPSKDSDVRQILMERLYGLVSSGTIPAQEHQIRNLSMTIANGSTVRPVVRSFRPTKERGIDYYYESYNAKKRQHMPEMVQRIVAYEKREDMDRRNMSVNTFDKFDVHKDWPDVYQVDFKSMNLPKIQRWFNTKAKRMIRDHPNAPKTQTVLCNPKMKSLMMMEKIVMNRKQFTDFVMGCRVYWGSMVDTSTRKRRGVFLSDFVPAAVSEWQPNRARTIQSDARVFDASAFEALIDDYKLCGHKPIFMRTLSYLKGDGELNDDIVPTLRAVLSEAPLIRREKELQYRGQSLTIKRLLKENIFCSPNTQVLRDDILSYIRTGISRVSLEELQVSLDRLSSSVKTPRPLKFGDTVLDYDMVRKSKHLRHMSSQICDYIVSGKGNPSLLQKKLDVLFKKHLVFQSSEVFKLFDDLLKTFDESGMTALASFIANIIAIFQQSTWRGVIATSAAIGLSFASGYSCGRPGALGPMFQAETFFYEWNLKEFLHVEEFVSFLRGLIEKAFNLAFDAVVALFPSLPVPRVSASYFVSETMKQLTVGTAKSAASFITSVLLRLFSRVQECFQVGSLTPLFTLGPSFCEWEHEANAFITFKAEIIFCAGLPKNGERFTQLQTQGRIPRSWTGPFSLPAYYDKAVELLERGNQFMKSVKDNTLWRQTQLLVSSLNAVVMQESAAKMGSRKRIAPFCIFLYGPPGTGKSVLVRDLINCIARLHGLPMTDDAIWWWQVNSNFQSGLAYQPFIVLDDVDQNAAPATAGQTTHCEAVVKLCNTAPFQVEQADVSLKGLIYAHPLFVIVCSNYQSFRAKDYIAEPNAVYRRMLLRAKVTVPLDVPQSADGAQSASTDSGTMSSSEIAGLSRAELEARQDFLVDYWDDGYKHLNNTDTPIKKRPFIREVAERFDAHLKRQLELLSRDDLDDKFCPSCGCPLFAGLEECTCGGQTPPFQSKISMLTVASVGVGALIVIKAHWAFQRVLSTFLTEYRLVVRPMLLNIDLFFGLVSSGRIQEHFNNLLVFPKEKFAKLALKVLAVVGALKVAQYLCGKIFPVSVYQSADFTSVIPTGWVRPSQYFTPQLMQPEATHSHSDLMMMVRTNTLQVFVGDHRVSYALAISNDMVIMNKHVVDRVKVFELRYPGQSLVHRIEPNPFQVGVVNGDLVAVKVPGLVTMYPMRKKMLMQENDAESTYTNGWIVFPDRELAITNIYKGSLDGTETLVGTTQEFTQPGDCGLPYVVKTSKGLFLMGIHCRGHDVVMASNVYAARFSALDFVRISSSLATSF